VLDIAGKGIRVFVDWIKKLRRSLQDPETQLADDLNAACDGMDNFVDKTKEAVGEMVNLQNETGKLNNKLSGGGSQVKTQKAEYSQGQYGYEAQEIRKLQELKNSASGEELVAIEAKIRKLQQVVDLREKELSAATAIAMADAAEINKTLAAPELGAKKIQGSGGENVAAGTVTYIATIDTSDLYKIVDETKEKLRNSFDNSDIFKGLIAGANGLSSIMRSMGKVVGDGAAAWLDWGANAIQAIASAIPQIAALTAAKTTEGSASAFSATTGAASAVSSIPIVGPILAIAAIAAMIAAIASIPKFAGGGLIYGPTLGLMGEYAGASSNPEVIAPLDKLRSMMREETGGGEFVFRIEGRDLVAVQENRSRLMMRTR
jgi:hypothetical protein